MKRKISKVLFLLTLYLGLIVGIANGQSVISDSTQNIGALGYYKYQVEVLQDNVKIHVKFTCQSCDINFFISDLANFNAWKSSSSGATGIIRPDKVSLDETFTIPTKGDWVLVWDNTDSLLTAKTILIEDVSFSSDNNSFITIVVIGLGAVIVIGGGFYLYRRKKKQNTKSFDEKEIE